MASPEFFSFRIKKLASINVVQILSAKEFYSIPVTVR